MLQKYKSMPRILISETFSIKNMKYTCKMIKDTNALKTSKKEIRSKDTHGLKPNRIFKLATRIVCDYQK